MSKIYCSKCGEKLDEGSKFCTKCGTPVATAETKANNVIESFEKDPQLQDHWIKRLVAYIIDGIIVNISTGILLAVVLFPAFVANPFGYINITSFPFASGIAAVIYFVVAETVYGTTIGKTFMMLKVVTKTGEKVTFEKAVIRNISKIYPVLLLLDVIGGVLTSTDLNQKYTDRIANTKVV